MNLSQLNYFIAIARCGNLSAAARNLGISQQALSQYVLKIQGETELQLFDRKGNHLYLTEAGKVYYRYGKEILAVMERTRNTIQNLTCPPDHVLHIGVSSFSGVSLLARAMLDFFNRYPRTELIHHEGFTPSLLEMLRKGEIQFALATVDPADSSGIQEIPLTQNELVLMTPPFHGRAHQIKEFQKLPRVKLEEFRDEVFVMPTEKTAIYHQIMPCFEKAGFVPTVAYASANPIMQRELIRSGCGLGFFRYDPHSDLPQLRLEQPAYSNISIVALETHIFTEEEKYLIFLLYRQLTKTYGEFPVKGEITEIIKELSPMEVL